MLRKLTIRNFALISESEILFPDGLTTITGETGAGKSILLGALGLVLGQRADMQMLTNRDQKCVVEALFAVEDPEIRDWFKEQELDFSDEIIMRRELSPSGTSRAFINDTPVLLPQMRELGIRLIDIHSQHESLKLNSRKFQLNILDNLAGQFKLYTDYQLIYRQHLKLQKDLLAAREELERLQHEKDYRQFLLNELEEASIGPGELGQSESELQVLENATEIKQSLSQFFYALEGSEDNIVSALSNLRPYLRSASSHKDVAGLNERLEAVLIELRDIASEAGSISETVSSDPERLEALAARINQIHNLLQKHRVSNEEGLEQIREDLRSKSDYSAGLEEKCVQLEKKSGEVLLKLKEIAQKLRKGRTSAAKTLEKEVVKKLSLLGMPHATLEVALTSTDEPGESGMDDIRLLFSANKGMPPGDLTKIASGGEMSRVMFCVKSLTSGERSPVLVFDEIDTGVSGEVAGKLGSMMTEMASAHQMVCITHLPQIASRGKVHLFVYKDNQGAVTVSKIKPLNQVERVEEIARMLSGEKVTGAAMDHARSLLEDSANI